MDTEFVYAVGFATVFATFLLAWLEQYADRQIASQHGLL